MMARRIQEEAQQHLTKPKPKTKTKTAQGRRDRGRQTRKRNKQPTPTEFKFTDDRRLLLNPISPQCIHNGDIMVRWTSYERLDWFEEMRDRDRGPGRQGNETDTGSLLIRARTRTNLDEGRPNWLQRLSAVHYSSWEQFCEDGIHTPSKSNSTTNDSPSSLHNGKGVCSWSPGSDLISVDGGEDGREPSNLATLTTAERDLFISLAPDGLQGPYVLMDEVMKPRVELMEEGEQADLQVQKMTKIEQTEVDIQRTVEEEWDHDFQVLFEFGPWDWGLPRDEQQIDLAE